ncbi:MAG: hypothetical protein ACYCXN_08310, partial [Acidimicrobiales bacterium]
EHDPAPAAAGGRFDHGAADCSSNGSPSPAGLNGAARPSDAPAPGNSPSPSPGPGPGPGRALARAPAGTRRRALALLL